MDLRISFIGLGAMGWHMAGHLVKTGHQVWVANRTAEKAQKHAKHFQTQAVSMQQAVQADFIFSCFPTSADVETFIAQNPPKQGSIWIDCTSGVPQAAQRLSQSLQQQGVMYLDAPVSGQTVGAEKGTLTVMVGGSADAFQRAKPIIDAFAGLTAYVGESGAGFSVKAVNNTLMATHLWALAEGLTMLKALDVDLNAALNCINASSGQSSMSQNIMAQRVLNRSFPKTFALNLLQKDIGIATNLAEEHALNLDVFHLVAEKFNLTETPHATHVDFSVAVQCLEKQSQLQLS